MSIPEEAYRHMPALRGRVQDPLTSRFRRMEHWMAEMDAAEAAAGREPAAWRWTETQREASRRALLAGREGEDIWIFGYGSLIWDPAVQVAEFRRGRLDGFRRSFCMHLEGGRGSPECPGLMAALDADPGHGCEGVAMRIPGGIADDETRIMWMREMITGAYIPAFLPVQTPQGEVEAICFLADRANDRFVFLPRPERARRIATAEGRLGTNREYLENLLDSLHALGIEDPEMMELHAMVRAAAREQAAE